MFTKKIFRKLRNATLLTASSLLVLFSLSCGTDEQLTWHGQIEGELFPVVLLLDWTPNTNHAGIYIAAQKGWYEEEGIDLTILDYAGEPTQLVGAGEAHFGISNAESVIPARAQGIPVISIATIITKNTSSLLSLQEEGITRPRDLEGKSYGGWGGALETQIVEELVRCDGGDPKKVKFTEVGNVDYLVGMERDQYDFVWIFDAWDGIRYSEVEEKDVSTLAFRDYEQCIPNWYTPIIITNQTLIKEYPGLIKAFMKATARGYEFAIENPEQAANILLTSVPELDKELVHGSARWLSNFYATDGDWGSQKLKVWQEFELFLREAGLTSKKIDASEAFTNEFIP